ncbi:flagellar hook-associated protein FlgK [Horticoccus sp. 23ND18S-11]|uniref:flagellar hook-associated protein FlgK n=1 Tax=Horticoccus sp. 23ND18S-11 TaxID=3391832 RepID=UPI0039C8C5E6
MAGLYSSINATVKALSAQSRALEITGKNLANVNNPNYARQRVLFGDRGTIITPQGAESLGLEALGVEQVRDFLLDGQVLREIAIQSSFEAEQAGYQRAQAGLGQGIDRAAGANELNGGVGGGIAGAIDGFFNAFQSFAARPTDDGERQTLLQKAGILTDRLQLADARLVQAQSDLNAEIDTDVSEVNGLLDSVAELNKQISRLEVNAPGSAVDLRDQREAQLEKLAAKLPIEVRETASGQVQVVAKDASNADVMLVDAGNVQGTVAFNGTQITAGSPATVLGLSGGSIHGALTARDGAIQTLRDDLDALAEQFVTAVNTAYNPTNLTGDFFVASGTTAGTISLVGTLTASTLKASDGGPAGDNSVALAIARLATTSFSTGGGDAIDGSFSGFFSKTVSKLGQALADANTRVEDQTNIERLVRGQRDAVSGVSLDEEMADLLKYQRSFQASSRVFTVLDELLDNVVNRMGV